MGFHAISTHDMIQNGSTGLIMAYVTQAFYIVNITGNSLPPFKPSNEI